MSSSRENWMSLDEVASELRLPAEKVRELIAQGRLRALQVGEDIRVRPSSLERFVSRAESEVPRRRLRQRALVIGAGLLSGALAIAASSGGDPSLRQIPYKGYLEQNGSPVTAVLPMHFDLFTASTGGAAIWSEDQASVSVLQGHFNVALGSVTAISSKVTANSPLFLAITVNGRLLSGRQQLFAVPTSIRAQEAFDFSVSGTLSATGPINGSGDISAGGNLITKGNLTVAGSTHGNGDISTDGYLTAGKGINMGSEQVFYGSGRMHIMGEELLYVLNKSGVIIGKDWGGNGNLRVGGDLSVDNNTYGSCQWIGYFDISTPDGKKQSECPDGQFLAGIGFQGASNNIQALDMWQIKCCTL